MNFSGGEAYQWGGQSGDVPVAADFDGDGRTDLTIFRPSSGVWYTRLSSTGYTGFVTHQSVGQAGDVPVAGDFDGDGKSDITIYRPSSGVWYRLSSSSNYNSYWTRQWGGLPGDIPIAADFDGDGKADVTIFRPSWGSWLSPLVWARTTQAGRSFSGVSLVISRLPPTTTATARRTSHSIAPPQVGGGSPGLALTAGASSEIYRS